ncbi:MAG: hypothetical protein ABJA82_00470 [Myxococcales bacterium]
MDIELRASIAKVTLGVKDYKGAIVRKCLMAFDREFDGELAAALGGGAKMALKGLQAKEMTQVVIDIDAIEAKAVLVSGDDTCGIDIVRGKKATFTTAGDEDGEILKARLEFESAYADEVWSFLGRNCGAYVRIDFTSRQMELGVKGAIKRFKDSIPEGTTVSINGHPIT